MLFFQMEAQARQEEQSRSDLPEKSLPAQFTAWNARLPQGVDIYVTQMYCQSMTLLAALSSGLADSLADYAREFLDNLPDRFAITSSQEITLTEFCTAVRKRQSLADAAAIMARHKLEDLSSNLARNGAEYLIEEGLAKEEAMDGCRRLLCGGSLGAELERIYAASAPRHFIAHPVQYAIVSDSAEVRRQIRELLLRALYANGRLASRRCYLPDSSEPSAPRKLYKPEPLNPAHLKSIYEAQAGATVILPLANSFLPAAGNAADSNLENLLGLLPLVRKYRHEVLTVIELNRKDEQLYQAICEELTGVAIVRLDETLVFKDKARQYLCERAQGIEPEQREKLLARLPQSEQGYLLTDLQELYENWYDEYVQTQIYPSYRAISELKPAPQDTEPQGSAYQELQELIGLRKAKQLIGQMLDFHQAQLRFEAAGMKCRRPSMHMAFTGNPGTAKTTVARLVARIMKDNGLLSTGNLIETGRKDLVDRYVGGTALRVKAVFKKAIGSVLFIDEAYSLLDCHHASFGDEAINTIVQEMENCREQMVVILAGYPQEMEELLERNPGLRSRIAFHIPFDDYNAEEMLAILHKFAKDEQMLVSAEADAYLLPFLEEAMRHEPSGNGRLARNIYEQARFRQASRLMRLPAANWDSDVMRTLLAEDFSRLEENVPAPGPEIGFRPLRAFQAGEEVEALA